MNCEIRTWLESDAANLALVLNNMNILQNLRDGLPFPYTEKDALGYIQSMLASDKTNNFAFAITLSDVVVGSIGVFRQSNIHRQTAELGYYVSEKFWGQGIGSIAVQKVCKYVFENSDIVRIFAEPFSYNKASCRILEENGFVFEGTLRNNACKNGKMIDMKMYSLIKEDFLKMNT